MTNYYAAPNDLVTEDSRPKVAPAFTLKNVRQVKEGHVVLDNIELEIAGGATTALIGPSGAGKTSLLRLLNRLDDPVSGDILYRSRALNEYPVQELRRQVGFVFQTPVMFPGTVSDNLRKALELAGKPVIGCSDIINEALSLAELDASLADRDGDRLSVGQKQRVNIARALMTTPDVLLMDEPTSALDPETSDRLMETIRRLGQQKGITVVMITHRLSEARRASDSTIVMVRGRVVEVGATTRIFEQTANVRLREFTGSGK